MSIFAFIFIYDKLLEMEKLKNFIYLKKFKITLYKGDREKELRWGPILKSIPEFPTSPLWSIYGV